MHYPFKKGVYDPKETPNLLRNFLATGALLYVMASSNGPFGCCASPPADEGEVVVEEEEEEGGAAGNAATGGQTRPEAKKTK